MKKGNFMTINIMIYNTTNKPIRVFQSFYGWIPDPTDPNIVKLKCPGSVCFPTPPNTECDSNCTYQINGKQAKFTSSRPQLTESNGWLQVGDESMNIMGTPIVDGFCGSAFGIKNDCGYVCFETVCILIVS